jgi:hypothetical protein
VTKAKKTLIDCGLLYTDFSTACLPRHLQA